MPAAIEDAGAAQHGTCGERWGCRPPHTGEEWGAPAEAGDWCAAGDGCSSKKTGGKHAAERTRDSVWGSEGHHRYSRGGGL